MPDENYSKFLTNQTHDIQETLGNIWINNQDTITGIIIFALFLVFLMVFIKLGIPKTPKENKKEKEKTDFEIFSIKEYRETLDFLDRIIQDKYQYYMYLNLLPIYMDRKIPEKKVIQDTKEKIYVSVVGGITLNFKKKILNIFTEKGIEIYINEKIIVLINQTDFASTNHNEAFKEVSSVNVDKIL